VDTQFNISDLPVLPEIITLLFNELSKEEPDTDKIISLIEKDPGFTIRLLKLANSAFYSPPEEITTVRKAVLFLGFNAIFAMLISIGLKKFMDIDLPYTDDKNNFWLHSLASAVICREILQYNTNAEIFKELEPDEGYIGSLLHDIGKVFLYGKYKDKYKEYVERLGECKNYIECRELELEIFGITGAMVGEAIAKTWKLPSTISKALSMDQGYKELEKIVEEIKDCISKEKIIIFIVSIADFYSHKLGFNMFKGEVFDESKENIIERISKEYNFNIKFLIDKESDIKEKILDFNNLLNSV